MGKSVPQSYLRTNDIFLAITAWWNDVVDRGQGLQSFYFENCTKRIILDGMTEPPRVCIICGDEFDWDAVNKKESKICTTRRRDFHIDAEFCGYCIPPIKLEKGYSLSYFVRELLVK